MSKYPPADAHTQWFESRFPGSVMNPNVLGLHDTESIDWPTYSGGAVAPTYTVKPLIGQKKSQWRQHFPDERSARGFVNAPGGVETNTLNVIQVEIVGTCDPAHAKSWGTKKAGVDYLYLPDAPDWFLDELAKFVVYCHKQHGIKLEAPRFEAYPASFGTNNGVRFTDKEWENFYGICGHQHVPENVHGDPGALDVPKIIELAQGILNPPAPTPTPAPKQTERVFIEYNLATPGGRGVSVGEARRQVQSEVVAILATGPDGLALDEAIHYLLPHVPGYDLTHDTSTPGRADVALYLKNDRHLGKPHYKDLHETWGRTQHGGEHPARAILYRSYGGLQVVVEHQPPEGTDNVLHSQQEGVNALARIMAPWTRPVIGGILPRVKKRERILLTDANRAPTANVTLPGPHMLATRVGGTVAGDKIDCAVVRNLTVTKVRYVTKFGDVELHSDHKHAVVVHVKG